MPNNRRTGKDRFQSKGVFHPQVLVRVYYITVSFLVELFYQVLKPETVQSVRTLMYGCGMHNHSGKFAFDVSHDATIFQTFMLKLYLA